MKKFKEATERLQAQVNDVNTTIFKFTNGYKH